MKNQVADFKVPSEFIIVEELPRNSMGKIQRINLETPTTTRLQRGSKSKQMSELSQNLSRPKLSDAISALRIRDFRRFWFAGLASNSGGWLQG